MGARNFPKIKKEDEIIFLELARKGEEFYNKFGKECKEKKDKKVPR